MGGGNERWGGGGKQGGRERDVKLKNVRFWSRPAVKTKIPFL